MSDLVIISLNLLVKEGLGIYWVAIQEEEVEDGVGDFLVLDHVGEETVERFEAEKLDAIAHVLEELLVAILEEVLSELKECLGI